MSAVVHHPPVASDALASELLLGFAAVVRGGRRARRWTQAQLAAAVGASQSQIDRIEHARVRDLSIRITAGILQELGGRLDARFIAPQATALLRDEAHARGLAYLVGRLRRDGWLVATEVEIGAGRWRAFADVLAFHPDARVLLVIEVKTEIRDLGEIDRQLGVAERGAWDAAHAQGWRPWRVIGVLLVLETDENDRRLAEHRSSFDRGYDVRWRQLRAVLDGSRSDIPARDRRGLAMFDPRSRRREWLRPASIDGRRTPAPYADRIAYLAGARR